MIAGFVCSSLCLRAGDLHSAVEYRPVLNCSQMLDGCDAAHLAGFLSRYSTGLSLRNPNLMPPRAFIELLQG